jgi:hypothetical protein
MTGVSAGTGAIGIGIVVGSDAPPSSRLARRRVRPIPGDFSRDASPAPRCTVTSLYEFAAGAAGCICGGAGTVAISFRISLLIDLIV